jgi:hypothetical protein
MNRLMFFVFMFFWIAIVSLCSYTEDELRTITLKIRREEDLSPGQQHVLEAVWEKFTKGQAISVFEDNMVFHYMNSQNSKESQLKHPRVPEWVLYRRLSVNGFSLAAHHLVKEGFIHEFLELREDEEPPYHIWFPVEPNLVVFESGAAPYRRLRGYYLDKADVQTLVLNTHDNYSPVFSPDGQYLLYLSDRDRVSDKDKRVSVYARGEQGLSSKEIRLTDLLYIEGNTNKRRDAILFIDDDKLQLFVDGKKTDFSLEKLLDEAERLSREIARNLHSAPADTSGEEIKLIRRILSEDELKDGVKLTVYEKDGEDVYLELVHHRLGKRQLFLMKLEEYKKIQGPLWREGPQELLFLRSFEGRYEIWAIDLYSGQEKQVSRKYENCFGMAIDGTGKLFAHVLERAGIYFVFVQEWPELKPVADYVAEDPEWVRENDLLRFSGSDLLYRSENGVFRPFSEKGDSSSIVNVSDQPDIKGLPVFLAPYQLRPLPRKAVKKDLTDAETESAREGVWPADFLDREIKKLTVYIKAARSARELDEVRMRFNTLHEQIRIHREKPDSQSRKTTPATVLGWIRELNRQKEAIGAAEILLQKE